VLTSSVIDRGFKPLPVQTKDHNIGICCFSAKHASLRSKCKDWLALYPNHVSKWSNMSNRDLIHSSTLQEICGRHHYLVNRYRTSVLQIIMPVMDIYFVFRNHNPVLSSFMTYHTVCNKSSMMVPNVEQKLITLSEHPSSSPVFVGFVLLNL
jgi:hypothetical protein